MEITRPFPESDWNATPPVVQHYIKEQEKTVAVLESQNAGLQKQIEKFGEKVNENSQNSNKPPSTDNPFKKERKKKKDNKKQNNKRKIGGQPGHKGHQQKKMEPTRTVDLKPDACDCGNDQLHLEKMAPFYIHQQIELPEINMDVTHFILHKRQCRQCGKTIKAKLSKEQQPGYGSRLSALIAEISGIQGNSRETVQSFCESILDFSISIGAIQKVVYRASEAIKPIYDKIGEIARTSPVNNVDETPWYHKGKLHWLWALVNPTVAFFMIHKNRSKKAFEELIQYWAGILVSDNYGVYRNWVNKRQSCLAHLIRRAQGLCGQNSESAREFGEYILKELKLLCHWANAPPDEKEWTDFFSRFIFMLILYEGADDDVGRLARLLGQEMDSLWVFLEEEGVDPTNNRAEQAVRFGVLWRRRSYGTKSDKGDRWVERILSVRQTCRMKKKPVFPILVNAIESYFKEQQIDLGWLK